MTNPDFETDATGQTNPLDPDPAVPGVDNETADTVGVPVGSAAPVGESDFIDGREVSDSPQDADSMETPIMPLGATDEADTED